MKKVITIATTIAVITMAMVSTSAKIVEGDSDKTITNKVTFASKEKIVAVLAFAEASKQSDIDFAVAEEARIAKEKADVIAAEKVKQDELDKQAADKKAADKQVADKKAADKKAADKARQDAIDTQTKIAAAKAKQADIDKIAADRANKEATAKAAADLIIAKAASDKAAAELEAAKAAKIVALQKAKVDADNLAKKQDDIIAAKIANNEPVTQEDKDAKVAADKAAQVAANNLLAVQLGLHQSVTEAKFAAYLSSNDNISNVLAQAVILHNGNPSNTCVYFSSEAMRRIGIAVPTYTCNTGQYLTFLGQHGWVSNYDIRKLTPGSICFTTNDWSGHPTHTFAFLSWVSSGNYTLANVADNQDNKVHVRNMGATKETDAFAFFMHN